jgi:cellulose synthase/poly-beta-1,6-N-acetylglucosamine synthase-like glycosyltransferase
MGLIRKSVLEEIGGWDEWCITEDAEASLRILKKGYQSLYINRAFGRGLMPFNFEGLKKQRFRWCFGGIQILKKHWEALMPWAHWVDPTNKLTLAQRYHYLVGGLGWFSDVFNLLFAFFLVLGAVFNLFSSPVKVRPLTDTILIIPAVFLFLHILRFIWVLRNRLRVSIAMAAATMYNFFSLGWAVTLACIQGLVQREGVFLRTPKATTSSKAWRAIQVTQWEMAIGLICILAGLLAFGFERNWRTFSLCVLLIWQGGLYLAALLYSLLSLKEPRWERLFVLGNMADQ